MLELDEVVGGIHQEERPMLRFRPFESHERRAKEWCFCLAGVCQKGIEILPRSERNPKVSRIHLWLRYHVLRSKVADQLIAKEIKGDPVFHAAAGATPEHAAIERLRFVEVSTRNGQMERVVAVTHSFIMQPAPRRRSRDQPCGPVQRPEAPRSMGLGTALSTQR